MQVVAMALAFFAFLSLLGVLGPAFDPGDRGTFIMIGGLVSFAVFAGLAAAAFLFSGGDADI